MFKAKTLWFACLLLCTGAVVSAAEIALAIPAGGRIGVLDLMTADVTHFHLGSTPTTSFLRTYRGGATAADIIDEPLIWQLTHEGFEPVAVQPSDVLRRQKQDWIIANPRAEKLPKGCLEELGKLFQEERLSALIIVAPGPNTAPESVAGNRMRQLPEYVQGWGFSTSEEPGGLDKPKIFNLTQMLLVQKTTDGVRLQHREWGGAYLYDWDNFTPPPDMKKIPASEIANMRVVVADVMKRQIARLMPSLKN